MSRLLALSGPLWSRLPFERYHDGRMAPVIEGRHPYRVDDTVGTAHPVGGVSPAVTVASGRIDFVKPGEGDPHGNLLVAGRSFNDDELIRAVRPRQRLS